MIEQLAVMPEYEAYKDSGVEWLGEVPAYWLIRRLKFISTIKTGEKDTVHRVDNGQYPFFIRSQQVQRIDTFSYSGEAILTAGDGDIGKIFHYIDGKFDYHQRVYKFSDFKEVCGKYLYYYLHFNLAEEVIKLSAKTTVDSLRLPFLQNFSVVIPPLPEQTVIAAFLDRKTAQLDQAVAIKEKQIALLKERKQILIQKAVTRGLNPDAPMRDSGVAWLGEIPAHWNIKKLKYIVRFVSGATPSKDRAEYWNGIIPWISPKDMKRLRIDSSIDSITDMAIKKSNIRLLDIGTILIVVRGMILAKKIPVALSKVPLTINQDMKGLVPAPMCFPEYLLYLLDGINGPMSTLLEESGHGTKTLPTEKLGQLTLGIPPKHEQIAIVAHIETESVKIDQAISIQQQQIDKLKEYKATLINSAVTGKIRVPEISGEKDAA